MHICGRMYAYVFKCICYTCTQNEPKTVVFLSKALKKKSINQTKKKKKKKKTLS